MKRLTFLRNGIVAKDELHYCIRINLKGQVYGDITHVPGFSGGRIIDTYPQLNEDVVGKIFDVPSSLKRKRTDEDFSIDTKKDLIVICFDADTQKELYCFTTKDISDNPEGYI